MNDEARIPAFLCDACQGLELWKTNIREGGLIKSGPRSTRWLDDDIEYYHGTWEDVKRNAKKRPRCPGCVALLLLAKFDGYVPGKTLVITWTRYGGFFDGDPGSLLAFMNEETATSPMGSARAVQPHIDPLLIKKWVKLCETHHEGTCTARGNLIRTSDDKVGLKVLRLIDVEEWCIVEAVPGVRYLALSYVWGELVPPFRLERHNLAELSTKGALIRLREKLPKTIIDALDLVQLIGERYLWLDSLCLIQDDENDMLDGISHMDLVYQHAALTIVAAYGKDANAGLPGVHPGSREVNQKIIEVLPGVKMCHLVPLYNRFMYGGHSDRAWTFQELVLSCRTLIFTTNRIYFRCRANCWGEDIIYDKFPSVINTSLGNGTETIMLTNNEPEPLSSVYSAIFRYQYRNLTKESDRVHGFTGILRLLSTQMRSGVLEGLFTASFDISLLFWTRLECLKRREGFPSWSWAGWENTVYGYGQSCGSPEDANSWLQTNTYIVWYKRSPATAKLELVWDLPSQLEHGKPETHHIGYRPTLEDPYGRTADRSLENLKTRPDDISVTRVAIIREELMKRKYHFLHFFAHVVHVQRFGKSVGDWQRREILGQHRKQCGWIQSYDPTEMEIPGPHELVLLSKMDKDRLAVLSKTNHGDEFLQAAVDLERPIYWVMCIGWLGRKKVVAESKAIGFLYQDCMKDWPRSGKVWKEIVLA